MKPKRIEIQCRVRPGGPNYASLPESDKRWSRWEKTSRNWANRRLAKLRRTAAYQKVGASSTFGKAYRFRLLEFRLKPPP